MIFKDGPGGQRVKYEEKDRREWNSCYLQEWNTSREGPQFWINIVLDFLSRNGYELAPKGGRDETPKGTED